MQINQFATNISYSPPQKLAAYVQRWHNRQIVFVADDDFNYYRENLIHLKEQLNCKVYVYCLITNHVHLIVDPGDNVESLSLLVKELPEGRQDTVTSLKSGLEAFGRDALNQALFPQMSIFNKK